jgi:hypothetical protein
LVFIIIPETTTHPQEHQLCHYETPRLHHVQGLFDNANHYGRDSSHCPKSFRSSFLQLPTYKSRAPPPRDAHARARPSIHGHNHIATGTHDRYIRQVSSSIAFNGYEPPNNATEERKNRFRRRRCARRKETQDGSKWHSKEDKWSTKEDGKSR